MKKSIKQNLLNLDVELRKERRMYTVYLLGLLVVKIYNYLLGSGSLSKDSL